GKRWSGPPSGFAEQPFGALQSALDAVHLHPVDIFDKRLITLPEGRHRHLVATLCQRHAEVSGSLLFASLNGWIELREHQDSQAGLILSRMRPTIYPVVVSAKPAMMAAARWKPDGSRATTPCASPRSTP